MFILGVLCYVGVPCAYVSVCLLYNDSDEYYDYDYDAVDDF